jgi:hypothetical protein
MHAQRFAKRGLPTRTAPHPAAAQSPLLRDDLQEMVPARLLLIMARVTASMATAAAGSSADGSLGMCLFRRLVQSGCTNLYRAADDKTVR